MQVQKITKASSEFLYEQWLTYTDDGWYEQNAYCIDEIHFELISRKRNGDVFLSDKELTV